jgi:NADPH:quinone reductase-like Zn-dependent oxidoreductase
MKAVVKYGKGKGLMEIRDIPEPKIKNDDEVLIPVVSAIPARVDFLKSASRKGPLALGSMVLTPNMW